MTCTSSPRLLAASNVDEPKYISQQTAAKRGDMSVKMVRALIASGELPAKRVGPRVLRIRTADFDALLSA